MRGLMGAIDCSRFSTGAGTGWQADGGAIAVVASLRKREYGSELYRTAFDLSTELGQTIDQARIAQELGVVEWALRGDDDSSDIELSRSWLLRGLELFRSLGDRKGRSYVADRACLSSKGGAVGAIDQPS